MLFPRKEEIVESSGRNIFIEDKIMYFNRELKDCQKIAHSFFNIKYIYFTKDLFLMFYLRIQIFIDSGSLTT